MQNSKFNLDGPAFEESTDSTRQLIRPDHVMQLQEEEEVMEAGVDTQNTIQPPPGLPAPQEEQGEQAADTPEIAVLKCVMEDACDPLKEFREFERYSKGGISESDSDVPEDELTDEMEDIFSDEDQQVPESLQLEVQGPGTEEDHGEQSPRNIPLDDKSFAIEENFEPSVVNFHGTLVNVQVPEREDPSTPSHLDEMEDNIAIEEDQLVPVNLQEAEHFTEVDHNQSIPVIIIPVEDICSEENELNAVNFQQEGDPTSQGIHDQTSHPGNIPLQDLTAIEEDEPNPVNLEEEEDFTVQGDHDQPNPVIIPAEDIIAIQGNEMSPVNLHLTVVNVQTVTEPEHPNSTPRTLDLNYATFDSVSPRVSPEADQEVIPEIFVGCQGPDNYSN